SPLSHSSLRVTGSPSPPDLHSFPTRRSSDLGCLAGVTRALVLEWFGGEEEDLALEDLYRADEAFLTSTTRDVQPIRAVDDTVLPAAPGPVTAKAMEAFAARSAELMDP